MYKGLIFDQLSWYANKIFSKLFWGFRKACSMQHVSLNYFSHGKRRLTSQYMLAQCSRISQKFITVSLTIYWLLNWKHAVLIKLVCICLLRHCLSNRKQMEKLCSSFSDWWDVVCGIPQVSVLSHAFLCSKIWHV